MSVDPKASRDAGHGTASDDVVGRLTAPDVGLVVVRGAAIRTGGYALGVGLSALGSVFLLRYLSVADFGRYVTVASLIAIVSGLAEAGLSTVGARELALRSRGESRDRLVSNLLGVRLSVTAVGVVLAVGFAAAVGYEPTLVLGSALMGVGLLLTNAHLTMTLPLGTELAIGRQTTGEVIRHAVTVGAIVLLVAVEASLLAFFGIQILVGIAVLLTTPWLVGRAALVWRPTFDRREWLSLLRLALPLAVSAAMAVLYFRLLMLLVSLLSSAEETGLFATSFRVWELLYGVASVAVAVALPVLSAAAHEHERLRYIVQRMTEAALIVACYLSLVVFLIAEPILRLLGGVEYEGAAPVLEIQVFALTPVFLAQVWLMGLVAMGRFTAPAIASGTGIALAGGLGVVLIQADGAEGAAVASVVGETGFAIALLVLLTTSRKANRLSPWILWKVACAAGAAVVVVLALPASPWVDVVAATAAYATVIVTTRALPPEIRDTLRRIRRGSSRGN